MQYKTVVVIFLILVLSIEINATENKDSTKVFGWFPSVKSALNISQISLKDWSQGGSNSLTWVFTLFSGLDYKGETWHFRNNLKLAYGRTKLGEEDFKTNDNELFLESIVSRKIGWAIDPFFSNTVRTAISEGYSYKKLPPTKIANFFDPGYLTQSFGFTYDGKKVFKTRLGIAVQEVFTNEYRQYSDDKSTKDKVEAFKLETGFESVTDTEIKVDKNLSYKAGLRLFSRFESLDVWDIRWDNLVTAKVNSYVNVSLNFLIVYEKAQSYKTQMKQTLLLGLSYTII